MKRAWFALAVALVTPAWLSAQTSVDQRRAAAANAEIEIENMAGTTTVVGWDKAEVWVKGTLAPDAQLQLGGSDSRIHVEVEVDGNPLGAHSDIEVHVPAGANVEIDGFQAEIKVSGVQGLVHAETVNGGITLDGKAREANLQSVNGAVQVTGAAGRVHVEVVNGAVTVKDASGEVEASSVNGEVRIVGGSYERASLESVAGGVSWEAALSPQARLDVETVSGPATVMLGAGVKADFTVSTFSGDIDNELGPRAVETSRFTPEKQLTFSTGGGGARISIQTLSGSVHIKKRP